MTGGYRITRRARRDFQEIAEYWTLEAGEKSALKVVCGILEKIITMSGYPRAGVAADRFGDRTKSPRAVTTRCLGYRAVGMALS
jgi:plasmid stabilization system protein ParE